MGCLDVISNLLGLMAILLVIVGAPPSDQDASSQSSSWALIALLMQPVLLAVGDVLIKKMKKLPEHPVSFAQGAALTMFAGTCMLVGGEKFDFIAGLSW